MLLRFHVRACVVLACIAAMLCATTNASALERVQTKTRVWDFSFAHPLNIRPIGSASPRTHLENQLASSEPASGSPHAARAGAEALQVGRFRLTETVGKHLTDVVKHGANKGELARPYLRSPHTIEQIMKGGKGVPDPGGVPGALRWDVPGTFRGSQGTWELVVDKSNTILHMNFR